MSTAKSQKENGKLMHFEANDACRVAMNISLGEEEEMKKYLNTFHD